MFRDPQHSLLHVSVCGLLVIVFFFAGSYLLAKRKPYQLINEDLSAVLGLSKQVNNKAQQTKDPPKEKNLKDGPVDLAGHSPAETERVEEPHPSGTQDEASDDDHVLLKLSGFIALVPLLGFICRMLAVWWFEPWNVARDPARKIVSRCAAHELLSPTACPVAAAVLDEPDPSPVRRPDTGEKENNPTYRDRLKNADPDWLFAFYFWPRVDEGVKDLIDNRNHFVYIYQNLMAATWIGYGLAMGFYLTGALKNAGTACSLMHRLCCLVLLGIAFWGVQRYFPRHIILFRDLEEWESVYRRRGSPLFTILTFIALSWCSPASGKVGICVGTIFWLLSLTLVERRMHRSARTLDLAWVYSHIKSNPRPVLFDKKKPTSVEAQDECDSSRNNTKQRTTWDFL